MRVFFPFSYTESGKLCLFLEFCSTSQGEAGRNVQKQLCDSGLLSRAYLLGAEVALASPYFISLSQGATCP